MGSETLFIRLLEEDDKGPALVEAVAHVRSGNADRHLYEVAPASFAQVPGSPFAYWVSERIRRLFRTLPSFIEAGYLAQHGVSSKDDFRFLRLWWEVNVSAVRAQKQWLCFAKGGEYSPFYADVHLLINWLDDARELEAALLHKYPYLGDNANWVIHRENAYFRPGLTWPRRTNGLSFRALPAGCIFADKGPAAFVAGDDQQSLLALLSVVNSAPFGKLVELQLARTELAQSYEVGLIQQTPVPNLSNADRHALAELARRAWSMKRELDTVETTSHAFTVPALLQVQGASLAERVGGWNSRVRESEARLVEIQREIDSLCFDLYGFTQEDRVAALGTAVSGAEATENAEAEDETETEAVATDASSLAADLMDWLIGVAVGRFDARLAIGERKPPPEPEPFDPLPVCSPGMLTDQSRLPARRHPEGYPVAWPEDGILVDDPGMGGVAADRDIVRRARQVIEVVWGDKAGDIERELCALLGVQELRDYLRKPSLFFDAHLKRYSKSRRKAPIYWPLSSASGSYTVWVYYPRLTADTLYKIATEHVGPKIGKVEDRIAQLEGEQAKLEGREAARAAKELGELTELSAELKELREELLRVAKLPYKPDLNDGVQITAAPLWRLFRLPRWRAELEKTWKALERGDYDWAHLAYAIWPDRVKEKCKTDKSLAIAHGLEKLYEEPNGGSAKAEARESKAKQTSKKQKKAARGKR